MAVYKSTRCYPFLNNVDIRVTQALDSNEQPVQYLKCKVDTSNKQVTGYKIRILDEANNQVFPLKGRDYISPISELQTGNMEDIYERNGINSGLNGTYLYIPFFQNLKANKTYSFNALYYTPQYRVDHIVLDNALYSLFKGAPSTISGANNLDNWQEDIGEDYYWLKYNWPPTSVEDHISNNIQLDGETLLEGQKVLVAAAGATSIRRGIYTVTKAQAVVDGQSIIQTVLQFSNYITNTQALVTHGEMFHNTVWSRSNYIAEDSGLFQELTPYTSTPSDGYVTVPNMRVSNSFYKWEITLYQGEGTVVGDSYGKYITYDSLGYQDYDMTVASGTILGSTSSRIQIASTTPFGETAPILPGLKQGVLVLQGKYMALGSGTSNTVLSNNRFYVKSYDSSYGHVYTLDGALDVGSIAQYKKAQFFKYSNNPDSILETDKVAYGCGYSVGFIYADISRPSTMIHDLDEFSAVGVNNRRYGVYKSELPSILLQQIKPGDKIIFTGEDSDLGNTDICQNGVYQVYDPNNSDLPTEVLWLKRAASYDSWGGYLGKVVYCPNYFGSQDTMVAQAVNLESLAGSGNYVLWDPDQPGVQQTKGGGPLYFTNERPILLFGQNFNNDYTYDLKYDEVIVGYTKVIDVAGGEIDGIPVQEGFTVLCRGGTGNGVRVVKAQMLNNELRYIVLADSLAPTNNQLYYITQGQNFGKKMFRGLSITPDWSLYTATVLRNTTGYTFITPALNVEKTMCLKLTQNKSITLSNDTTTSWLKISDVDKTVHCVKHSVLKTPFVSEISIDNNTPYKYEVRSYFKASDENPFSVCEAPYLILYKNNQEYSTLRNSSLYQEYWTTVELNILQQFNVTPSAGDTQVYLFKSYTDSAAVLDRAVKFSAKYTQFDGLSWESYRWTLFNADGVLLQDSGVKYDKSIAAVFYGLSNDSVQNSNYYVVLEVEDEKKNQLIYLIKVEVEKGSVATSASNFTAKFDCDNHAVRLDYIPRGIGSNSNKATIYRREYEVYERPGLKVFGRAEELSKTGKLYFTIPTPDGYKVADCKPNIIYVDERTDYYYELDETQKPIEIQVDDKKVVYKFIKMVDAVRIYKGEWSLVALKTELKALYDYNVTSGKRYQYLLYPNDTMSFDIDEGVYLANSNEQIFANSDDSYNVWEENAEYPNQGRIVSGSTALSTTTGAPVVTQWDEWSICELIPDTNIEDTPSIKKAYKVNKDQVWLFKYSLETGSQNQNISRKDIQTLGTYVKMGFGNLNYASGEVTALLGSELVLGTDAKYIERLKKSRLEALSTNEKVKMLAAWRDFVYSKNPKLLKDIKGQSWIVQIVSSSNNPKNFYTNQPDTITFQWKQVDDTFNTIIYSDAGQLQTEMQAYGSELWEPKFKFGSTPNDRFTIVWQNWDGSRFYDEVVEYNQIPTVPTNTPTREATAEYTYSFTKWEPELTKATENKIYTAQYSKTLRTYTVTWQWDDGELVQTYSYGEYPQYTGDEPSKPGYEFTGWTPDVTNVTQDVTYTAIFQSIYSVQFLPQNGTWYEDLQELSGLEPAPVSQITGVEYGEPIQYTNEDTRVPGHEDYEGCLIYYTHEEYGRIQGRFYFVPDEDTEDFTYDSGHVQGPDYVGQWEGSVQNVIGFSYREGRFSCEVTLTSGEEDPVNLETTPDDDTAAPPASAISGHWEDSEGAEVSSISALNGDTVYYYSLGYNADYVVITNIEIDLDNPPEFPQNISGTHLRWVFDDVGLYDVYAMYLLYQSGGTISVPADREGQYLGQISKDDENIIYAYVGEHQLEHQS